MPPLSLAAVIPAAGLSSRMHRFKPLLPLGNRPMVQQVIHLFQTCDIDPVIVVTGHHRTAIEREITPPSGPETNRTGPRNVRAVYNPDFRTGMRSSIQAGVRSLAGTSPKEPLSGFFLLPVDIAAVRPATLHQIMAEFSAHPDELVIPTFNDKTGHPPLVPARLIPDILSLPPDAGLRDLFFAPHITRRHVPVHDRGILMDADTPEGYRELSEKYDRREIPDDAECRSILDTFLTPNDPIRDHVRQVARTCRTLTQAIAAAAPDISGCHAGHMDDDPDHMIDKRPKNHRPTGLDTRLIQAAARLHDICRKEKHHAAAGARILSEMGFPQVADIVSRHMDLGPLADTLTESQIVYFADKLCQGADLHCNFRPRFNEKIKTAPRAAKRIQHRYEAACRIQRRIETLCGRPVTSILAG